MSVELANIIYGILLTTSLGIMGYIVKTLFNTVIQTNKNTEDIAELKSRKDLARC